MSTGCPRLFEVEALRDGRLEGAERTRFEQHLRNCRVCSAEARALEALGEALRAGTEPDDELHARRERMRLLAAFDRSLVEPERSHSPVRRGLFVTAAAVALAMALVLWIGARRELPVGTASAVVHASEAASWSRLADGPRELVRLDEGHLWIHVAEGPGKRPLLVKLPDGEIEDIGTTFSVTVEGQRTMAVKVEAGRVLLRLEGRPPVTLDAGQSWSHTETAPVKSVPARTVSAFVTDSAEPRKPPPPEPAPRSTHGAALPAPSASEPPPDAASLDFKRAVATLNSGQHAAAASQLRRFIQAYPRDPRAEDAAYLSVLALQRAGSREAMKAAALEYLRRYPSGFRRAEVERLAE